MKPTGVTVVALIVVTAVLSALFALPVMWLWNGLMPLIFKLPVISYLQAWGLMILSGFLFKSSASNRWDWESK